MSFAFAPTDLSSLPDPQKLAIMDALVGALFADGKADAVELKRLETEFAKVPWGYPAPTLVANVQKSKDRIGKLGNEKEILAYIKKTADTIPSQLREKTLYTMGVIMFADKQVNNAEQAILGAFAQAFGLAQDKVMAIATAVKKS